MNTPNLPLQPAAVQRTDELPMFTPERWLLLGHSPAWCAAAQAWMAQHHDDPGPLGWRLRHGLLRLGTLATLTDDLRDALRTQPQLLQVLAEERAFGLEDGDEQAGPNPSAAMAAGESPLDLDAALYRQWPEEARSQLAGLQMQVGGLGNDFTDAEGLLGQADAAAAELWLLSGRSIWPRIGLPQANEGFEAEALAAFRHWASQFEAGFAPAELDAIYGSADTWPKRRSAPWQDEDSLHEQPQPGQEVRRPSQVQGAPLPSGLAARLGAGAGSGRLAAMALAAASAGGERSGKGEVSGSFDVSDSLGPPDRYTLRQPPGTALGTKIQAVEVELRLLASRWPKLKEGNWRLVLEIHTDGFPALIGHWPEPTGSSESAESPGLQAGKGKSWTKELDAASKTEWLVLQKQLAVSKQQLQAMTYGVELWLQAVGT